VAVRTLGGGSHGAILNSAGIISWFQQKIYRRQFRENGKLVVTKSQIEGLLESSQNPTLNLTNANRYSNNIFEGLLESGQNPTLNLANVNRYLNNIFTKV
jgi:hypothetical protein